MKKAFQVVKVTYLHSGEGVGFFATKDAVKIKPYRRVDVGFRIQQDDKNLHIARAHGVPTHGKDPLWCDMRVIPRKMIQSIRVLATIDLET